MSSNEEKIAILRKEAARNEEVKTLLYMCSMYYPQVLDYPNLATPGMKRGYNKLISSNITDAKLRNELRLDL